MATGAGAEFEQLTAGYAVPPEQGIHIGGFGCGILLLVEEVVVTTAGLEGIGHGLITA